MDTAAPADAALASTQGAPPSTADERQKQRLASLDVFRGITMAVMLLVDTTGDAYPSIDHAPWDGIHLADFVMPFFLLISGVSASISLKAQPGQSPWRALRRVMLRALRLFAVGLAVQGSLFQTTMRGPVLNFDLATFRTMGILQRIAIVFIIVAAVELFVPSVGTPRGGAREALVEERPCLGMELWAQSAVKCAVVLAFVAVGTLLTDAVKPPSNWPGCSPEEDLYPRSNPFMLHKMGCSASGWMDSNILGLSHVYVTGNNQGPKEPPNFGFDPEGVVTTMSAILPMFFGFRIGRVWTTLKDAKPVLMHWSLVSIPLLAVACILAIWIPFNKRLWSPSYSLFMCATGTLLYAAIFLLCDWGVLLPASMQRAALWLRWSMTPFQWLGSNCILFFVLSDCCGVLSWCLQAVSWGDPPSENNLVYWFRTQVLWQSFGLGANCEQHRPCGPVALTFTLTGLLFWVAVCGVLHRRGIFWKI